MSKENGSQRILKTEINRRELLQVAALGGLVFSAAACESQPTPPITELDQNRGLTVEEIVKYFPNPNLRLPLVNLPIIDDPRFHNFGETMVMALNYGSDFKPYNLDHKIKEAVNEGRTVCLTLAFPKNIAEGDLTDFLINVSQNYKVKYAIFGNEISDPRRQEKPSDYYLQYQIAREIFRQYSPQTRLFPYAEGYFDRGTNFKWLSEFLNLCQKNEEEIEGIAFQHYGPAAQFIERSRAIDHVLTQYNFSGKEKLVCEMGREQTKYLNNHQYADHLVQLTGMAALATENQEISFAAWFSLFDFASVPSKHTIFECVDGIIKPLPQAKTYLLATRFFYQDLVYVQEGRLRKINSKTAEGVPVTTIWNGGWLGDRYEVPDDKIAIDSFGNFIPGKVVNLDPSLMIPNSVFILPRSVFEKI